MPQKYTSPCSSEGVVQHNRYSDAGLLVPLQFISRGLGRPVLTKFSIDCIGLGGIGSKLDAGEPYLWRQQADNEA